MTEQTNTLQKGTHTRIDDIRELPKVLYKHELNHLIDQEKKALGVLDLDNTLIRCASWIGSDEWYSQKTQSPIHSDTESDPVGTLPKEIRRHVLSQFFSLMTPFLPFEYTQEGIVETTALLAKRYHLLIVTARNTSLQEETKKQLENFGIAPYITKTLLASEQNKGEVLARYLEEEGKADGIDAERLFVVDDKDYNLDHVKEVFSHAETILYTMPSRFQSKKEG